MYILAFTDEIHAFLTYLRDALNRLLLLFECLFDIINSFIDRINISTTFLFSFIVVLFGLFVAFSFYEIWRH